MNEQRIKVDTSFIIPTYDRFESLKETIKCIRSIPDDVNIWVVSDGNEKNAELLKTLPPLKLGIFKNSERRDWPYSINKVLQLVESRIYVPFADDITFNGKDFKNALDFYDQCFPDLDGVVGLGQDLTNFGMGAFTIFGAHYAESFPYKAVYCPDYSHYYSDQEHYLYSNSIGKYRFFDGINLKHRDRNERGGFLFKDKTNQLAHTVIAKDRSTFDLRQSKGLLWGKSFVTTSPNRRWPRNDKTS